MFRLRAKLGVQRKLVYSIYPLYRNQLSVGYLLVEQCRLTYTICLSVRVRDLSDEAASKPEVVINVCLGGVYCQVL